jgi:hypothetical protein
VLVLRHRTRGWETGHLLEKLGHDASQLGEPGLIEGHQRGSERRVPQPVRDRAVCERALGQIAARLDGRRAAARAPPEELLDQPGLPHARFSREEDHVRRSRGDRSPDIGHHLLLGLTSDQHGTTGRPISLWLVDAGGEQIQVRPLGRWGGLDPEFAFQRRGASVVSAHRARAVGPCAVHADQEAMGVLPQGIVPQQPLGQRRGFVQLACRLAEIGQLDERLEIAAAQPFPLLTQPLVLAPLEQLAPVAGHCRAKRVPALCGVRDVGVEQPLKHRYVELDRWCGAPAHRAGGDMEVLVGAGEIVTQGVQQVAQVGSGLSRVRVGPE